MTNNPRPVRDADQRPPKRRRLWLWFGITFLIVFFALAFYPMAFNDGRVVRQTMLWHYYLLEMQLVLNSSGNIGPTSGNAAVARQRAVAHLAISGVSGVAGAIMMGIGWLTRKRPKMA
jgi:hypothetical protein